MKFTLYTADCSGNEQNCQYPHQWNKYRIEVGWPHGNQVTARHSLIHHRVQGAQQNRGARGKYGENS